MNILIFNWRDCKNPLSGGAEIVTFEHAKAWVRAGHSVTWFTSWFQGAQTQEIIEGVDICRQGNAISVYLLAPFFYFFSGKKFDVIIDEIHGLPFFTPLYVRKPKIAFIHEVANEIWDYMQPFPFNIIGRLLEPIYFLLYKNIQFWTDASSTIPELETYGISKNHCVAIPCPVTNAVLSKLPKKEKNPTYLFVNRVVQMKGVEKIIRAFAVIHKTQPTAQLWIVGSGDAQYIKKLHHLTVFYNIAPCVTFWGKVSEREKLTLMREAHIFLHASVKEGWGLVVLEAASQGTPAIVYNVPGLRDSVKNDMTGIILSENTPSAMASAALLLWQNKKKYRSFQKNCLTWAKSLQWEDVTHQSLKLLTSL